MATRGEKGSADKIGMYVDESFGLDSRGTLGCRYLTKTASRQICERDRFSIEPDEFIHGFVTRMLVQIGDWAREEFPKQMWKWREAPLPIREKKNESPEVTLERAIVRAAGRDNIVNQLAVTSGYSGPFSGSRHAIDLAEKHSATSFEFIELKWPRRGVKTSETPFAAAIELLRYFAAFVAAQDHMSKSASKHPRTKLEQGHVLLAKQLRLTVLGPRHFYEGYSLSKVQEFLQAGLALYGKRKGWTIAFSFSAFPVGFDWHANGKPDQEALQAYNARVPA